jgi:hypothetical protein
MIFFYQNSCFHFYIWPKLDNSFVNHSPCHLSIMFDHCFFKNNKAVDRPILLYLLESLLNQNS